MEEIITRYKLTIEYDGTDYCGFQKQTAIEENSVEEILEEAVFKMTQTKIKIFVSGRTDAGVHAVAQVLHFDLNKKFQPFQIADALNNHLLGEKISVLKCEIVDENFHARFGAKMRHYLYKITNRRAPLALDKTRSWHVVKNLDIELMKEAAKFLIGEHDFSSFRDAKCQSQVPIRSIEKIEITKQGDEILIQISAKSFMHHMVRNIVGTLCWVGSQKISPNEMQKILSSKDRTKSGPNAPAHGLYFLGVDY